MNVFVLLRHTDMLTFDDKHDNIRNHFGKFGMALFMGPPTFMLGMRPPPGSNLTPRSLSRWDIDCGGWFLVYERGNVL